MSQLGEPTKVGEKVLATSRVIRNRTTGCAVNVASDFVLPDGPMTLPDGVKAGLLGVANGDVIAIIDVVYEYEAMTRPLYDGRLGWYPKDTPEEMRTVQQAKVCWPRASALPPGWLWQIRP